ncbi:MAG: tRNA (adenosine(37)-N6)-threonylcarbamoyltransferase complex transferase subunit TsaD [Candidatus Thermoplasmatota archaeon]|nr:tRNA (adenosine(37)-N6)-threonylcarbamoyltransferase complex transferase subunit TsaD [Candidatus Thermoplasmatota archaeon]
MNILSIETSCDETSAAITKERRIISNVVYSQIDIHKEYGGIYPILAKREHQRKIGTVLNKALAYAHVTLDDIDAVAVTFGPGLVIALEVGLRNAKELAANLNKPLIPVDHSEGHIFSAFAQNRKGNPKREINFPFLALVVSGGQTNLVLVHDYAGYEIIGRTLDDAAGEALDKAAKMLGMSYPGGPIIETLAKTGNPKYLDLPIPLQNRNDLDFSYSGLKTALKYKLQEMNQHEIVSNLPHICASFQNAVFTSIILKLKKALQQTGIKTLVVGGGVLANKTLRSRIRRLCRKNGVTYYQPYAQKLYGDNAGMIGIAAYFKYKNGIYLQNDLSSLDRVARPDLTMWVG